MNIAILLSGGTGTRFGSDIPKQYILINCKMVISYSLDVLIRHKDIDGIIIVAEEYYRGVIDNLFNENPKENFKENIIENIIENKFLGYVNPGVNRQMSIYNALVYINENYPDTKNVLIHDAARPYLTDEMVSSYFEMLTLDYDGVMPVLPMKDTVYYSEDGSSISSLLERERIYQGQAPEIFDFKRYLMANEALMPDKILKISGSTQPAIMAKLRIRMVKGDENNIKITTKDDLEKVELCLHRNWKI